MRRACRFCWWGRLRSMVIRTSKCSRARRSSSPLLVPDQPAACTVVTRCPASSATRSRGRFSSSRTCTFQHGASGEGERGKRLIARNGGKLVQEALERLSTLQIVEQRRHRHARPDEDRCAAADVRVAVGDRRSDKLHGIMLADRSVGRARRRRHPRRLAGATLHRRTHSSQPSSSSTRRRRSSAARASASACLNAATASGSGGTSSPMGDNT